MQDDTVFVLDSFAVWGTLSPPDLLTGNGTLNKDGSFGKNGTVSARDSFGVNDTVIVP